MGLESLALGVGEKILESATRENGALHRMGVAVADKIADKVTGATSSSSKSFGNHLQTAVANNPASVRRPYLAGRVALNQLMKMDRMDVNQARTIVESFDANRDGQVSREELKTGLDQLTDQLASLQSSSDTSASHRDAIENAQQAYQLGEALLNTYEGVSSLEGNQGLSADDISALAAKDGRNEKLSFVDWKRFLS